MRFNWVLFGVLAIDMIVFLTLKYHPEAFGIYGDSNKYVLGSMGLSLAFVMAFSIKNLWIEKFE